MRRHADKEKIPCHIDVALILQAGKLIESGWRMIQTEIDRAVAMEKLIGYEEESRGEVNQDPPKEEEPHG